MKRKPYRYLLYGGLRLAQGLALSFPREFLMRLAEGLGGAAFFLARRERKKTLAHLTLAYGEEKSRREIRELGRRVFIHFAQAAADVLHFPKLEGASMDCLVEGLEQFSIFDRVLGEGRGAILLTGHLGNWELMGALFRVHGYPGALIGRRIYYDKFNKLLLDVRRRAALDTFYQDAPPREFLKVLQRNEILAILADQDVDRLKGIFTPFFGRPAYTLTAPVKLALATGAPLVPTFLVRKGDRYTLLVEEPIWVEKRGSRQETIEEYTARWSRVMEEKVRAYPEQWVWMHRRWKTKPGERVGALAPLGAPGR